MKQPPEKLAARTTNEYRRFDAFGYFGLRLYLDSVPTTRDQWIKEIPPDLLLHRTEQTYCCGHHFKEWKSDGSPEYRKMYIPCPTEALAEAALLQHCAEAGGPFENPSCVYSYRLALGKERRGIFVPYFSGFQQRHLEIAQACKQEGNTAVLYVDIRKFYPSITCDHARKVWAKAVAESNLEPWAIDLGYKLLEEHATISSSNSLLTGPMFSHVIANLMMADIDAELCELLPGRYFRYVDDIILVGSPEEVNHAKKILVTQIDKQGGLKLNSNKNIETTAEEWLEGEHDYTKRRDTPSWMTFIGGLKHLLICKPRTQSELEKLFTNHGVRLSPQDYSEVSRELSFLNRMHIYAQGHWFRRKIKHTTPGGLLQEALELRRRYTANIRKLTCTSPHLSDFQKKRRIHQLKFFASRLAYLAAPEDLCEIAESLGKMKEMTPFSAIFHALDTSDITGLLQYGPRVAQAAARPLRALGQDLKCGKVEWDEPKKQARAILLLNGIRVNEEVRPQKDDEIGLLCGGDIITKDLYNAKDLYVRELAYLHGCCERRHEALMQTAFDVDEGLVLDMQLLAKTPS